jgi:hypothetical protein
MPKGQPGSEKNQGRREDQSREGQWMCRQRWMQFVIEIPASCHLVVDGYGDEIESLQEGGCLFVLVIWKG